MLRSEIAPRGKIRLMPGCIIRPIMLLAAIVAPHSPARAQTDYYNTDTGRPLHIEDAYPLERRGFEIQAAPVRLERSRSGIYQWSIEPGIAFGILPRTQIEIGVPLLLADAPGAQRSGVGGVDVSTLHNLNVETSLPALALAGRVHLPVGSLAGDASLSVKGIATRTFQWARFHVNAEYTFGDETAASAPTTREASRWLAGVAVDRTIPLRSVLLGGEILIEQPIADESDAVLAVGSGVRYQLMPRWALDSGVGVRLTGDDRGWYVTFGSAYAFGLPWHK